MFKLVVLSCLVAAGAAGLISPLGGPIVYGAPLLTPYNYRGPLSLAPGQPANVLGADGRPLDTLDVNLDRSAHYTAKILDGSGLHLLKKRSVLTPLAVSPYNRIGLAPSPYIAHSTPLLASSPLAYSTHIAPYTPLSYGSPIVHAW